MISADDAQSCSIICSINSSLSADWRISTSVKCHLLKKSTLQALFSSLFYPSRPICAVDQWWSLTPLSGSGDQLEEYSCLLHQCHSGSVPTHVHRLLGDDAVRRKMCTAPSYPSLVAANLWQWIASTSAFCCWCCTLMKREVSLHRWWETCLQVVHCRQAYHRRHWLVLFTPSICTTTSKKCISLALVKWNCLSNSCFKTEILFLYDVPYHYWCLLDELDQLAGFSLFLCTLVLYTNGRSLRGQSFAFFLTCIALFALYRIVSSLSFGSFVHFAKHYWFFVALCAHFNHPKVMWYFRMEVVVFLAHMCLPDIQVSMFLFFYVLWNVTYT